ncbi:MAG TPA: ATP synthase F0 subunit C [Clostridia bacterium]|nr:ATP synthase F0 subunit C [Clostridia bacterium]
MLNLMSLAAIELKGIYALSAAIAIAVVAAAGAISMGFAISKAMDAIARQPEAESKIRSGLILGLVFVETAIIFVLVVAILIIINIL